MKKYIDRYLLTMILTVGFILRFWGVWDNPPSLYGDELTMVYDTFSIMKTGHDQTGQLLPVTFSMGAGRPGGYIYSSIPFVALFGPTELGERMLSVLSGIGIISLMYLLGKRLLDERVGLVAALLTAISPWDISLSRGGFEAHYALFLALGGVVAFLSAKQKPWLLVLSVICWGLTIHTYPTYKLVLPLFGVVLLWFDGFWWLWERRYRVFTVISIVILMVAGIIATYQLLYLRSEGRFSQINAFSNSQTQGLVEVKVNDGRLYNHSPIVLRNLLENKYVVYSDLLTRSYLNNFSFDFLFLSGDGNPRHNMATMGEFYLIELIFVILGIFILVKSDKRTFKFLLGWLLIAPLATTLLLEVHALRSLFMLPPLLIFSAVGFKWVWNQPDRLIRYIFIVILVIQVGVFLNRLVFYSPNKFGSFWSYPAKQASLFINENKSKYDYVIVNSDIDNIEYAVSVYGKIDPMLVIDQNKQKTILDNIEFKKLNNIYIGSIPHSQVGQFINKIPGKVLYIGNPILQSEVKSLNIVNGFDNMPSFGYLEKI